MALSNLFHHMQYACNEVPLSELTASGGGSDGWSKYDVYLGSFNSSGPPSVQQVVFRSIHADLA